MQENQTYFQSKEGTSNLISEPMLDEKLVSVQDINSKSNYLDIDLYSRSTEELFHFNSLNPTTKHMDTALTFHNNSFMDQTFLPA